MTRPSSSPRGEHAGRPGTRWETILGSLGEHVIADNAPDPTANRATRRAAARRKKR
ncbi:hypothetical protein [Streptomyces sp. NPDC002913]